MAPRRARCWGPPRCLGPNVYPEAPDGGWGWVVAAAFFLVEVFTYGTIKSFGVFLRDVMAEFGESNSRVLWIVSICVFVMTFNGPLSSVLTNRFGFQFVVMAGGSLISVGTVATSFASSVNQMYLTYGLVTGLGYCLTFLPAVTILSQYFSRRRPLVTALASTGESLAMFALAPAFSALRDRVGWRRSMAVLGALQGSVVVCGALLRPIVIRPGGAEDALSPKELEAVSAGRGAPDGPDRATGEERSAGDGGVQAPEEEDSSPQDAGEASGTRGASVETGLLGVREEDATGEKDVVGAEGQKAKGQEVKAAGGRGLFGKSKLLDTSILREPSFILYSLFGLFATIGFLAPPLYVIELSVSRGVERERATFMLSAMAVAEVLGRFCIGWVLSRRRLADRKLLVLLACVAVMGGDLLAFTLAADFYGLAACCAVYGFAMGTLACTHIPMLAEDDVVGIDRMSSAAGVYVYVQSFAGLAGPPLGGLLVDRTNNYGTAFYFCAAGMALAAVFLSLVRPAKRGLLCRRRTPPRRAEETHHGKGGVPGSAAGESGECAAGSLVHEQPDATEGAAVISFA